MSENVHYIVEFLSSKTEEWWQSEGSREGDVIEVP